MLSKKQKVVDYFSKNPNAVPAKVSTKFKMALPAVYTCRKAARALKAIDEQRFQDESVIVEHGYANGRTPPHAQQQVARDVQEGGNHYKEMGVQPWDVVDTWSKEQQIGYYRGGALKYIMRMGAKDQSATEIAKGKHYMQKLLEVLGA